VAERLGGTPLALVTADRESHVVAVDLGGRALRRIRTSPDPRSIEAAFQTWAVIAHTSSGRLSILHAPTMGIRHVVGGFRAPRYTAIHPHRQPFAGTSARVLAYVTDSARREVVTVDVGRGAIVWRTAVPGPARHVGASPTGASLWTALGSRAERVAVLDLEDPLRPRLRWTFVPPFLAHDVVFTRQGTHVWVTSGDQRRIAIYEAEGDRRPVAVLDADAPPQHIAFRTARAFVASGDDGTVRLHAPEGTLLDQARVPVGSYNVTSYGDAATSVGAITPSLERGTLSILDERGRVRSVRNVARAAHDACLVVGP
jgi:hypothetical protein